MSLTSKMAVNSAGSPAAGAEFLKESLQAAGQHLDTFQALQTLFGDAIFHPKFNLTDEIQKV